MKTSQCILPDVTRHENFLFVRWSQISTQRQKIFLLNKWLRTQKRSLWIMLLVLIKIQYSRRVAHLPSLCAERYGKTTQMKSHKKESFTKRHQDYTEEPIWAMCFYFIRNKTWQKWAGKYSMDKLTSWSDLSHFWHRIYRYPPGTVVRSCDQGSFCTQPDFTGWLTPTQPSGPCLCFHYWKLSYRLLLI